MIQSSTKTYRLLKGSNIKRIRKNDNFFQHQSTMVSHKNQYIANTMYYT